MLVVGSGLELRHIRDLSKRMPTFVSIFLLQTAIPPIIGCLLVRTFSLPPPMIAGILLLAACPAGDIVNVYTYLARGNIGLSLSVNALSCLLAFVTMPAMFALYGLLLGETFPVVMPPFAFVLRVIWIVVLPVLIGMWVRQSRPGLVQRYSVTLRNLAIAGLALLTLYVIVSQSDSLQENWLLIASIGALFIVANAATGFVAGRILKCSWAERVTTGLLLSVRNVGFALVVAIAMFDVTAYSVFAVTYFLTELPLLLSGIAVYRRWRGARESKGHSVEWVQP